MGSPQSVYTLELSKLGQGYPLWNPEPPSRFEVEIGDIGFIADGSFYRLFRATEDPTHPINAKYGVPDGFIKLDIANLAVTRVENVIPTGPLVSPGVTKSSVGGQTEGTGAGSTFECTEDNGAILVLGAPAIRHRLRHGRRIKTYIRTHLRNWHTFAVKRLDLDLSEDDIIFVSGWVKTTAWSLAAFAGDAKNARITFSADGDGVAGGCWQINEARDANWAFEYHSGPPSDGVRKNEERRINKAAAKNENDDGHRRGKQDQCVFLHYYKLKKRFLCIKSMKAMAEPRSPSPGSDDHDAEDSPAPRKVRYHES
ncbi:uncharacterized protein LAESUDRAFT_666522 [Laetiporus sulphureus 93-53]|uniref:Uncharacterized protein n=1 Tax=Laetiporus sulphureus 93-53 TaxID=1314785 RepID=A0A165B4R7_9APHY|nr:uncharacterized protein LAESUDRAFT_666522 [Laetiporus sulphureus 93-53]KZT00235.1 hypothetical protein LAESUDRAFT_666522 [Laetiporus sulphureus 93-53]